MRLHDLRPAAGSRKNRKRVGRGHGSGRVKTAGRGTKGQKARSGGQIHPHFEGGQTPLMKRLPHKRGFVNKFRTEYSVVNLRQLTKFDAGERIGPEQMASRRLIASSSRLVKVLGHGDLQQPLTIMAHKFSRSAKEKIEAAGGTAIEIAAKGRGIIKSKANAIGTAEDTNTRRET